MMSKSNAIGHLAMLAFSAIVAFSFTFGKVIADQINPAILTAIRFVIGLCAMGIVALFVRVDVKQMVKDLWRWILIGACMAIYFNLMFVALQYTTSLGTSAVFTLTPLIAAGFGYVLTNTSVGRATILALTIGAIGATWVIFRGDFELFKTFAVGKGEAIFLVGAIAHAAVPALRMRLLPKATAFEAAIGSVFGALIVTLFFALPAMGDVAWAEIPRTVWLVTLYLGVAATAMSFFLLQVAVQRLKPGKVMAYTYLVPAWVVVHGVAFGHSEQPILYVGVALTLVALTILLFSDEASA
jgi:drug/metabolite transporter (DMT)-like permease